MEVVQGKSGDQKIVIAQEIAFAKVLAGNNKVLRDRALKKLKKWLSIRGHGKWAFTEDEFIRIWTGLFYCMWMSDKFLVQEELAENISHLIHCFRNNRDSALLFFKCFNKRMLMEYEGLDQYRIDKFHMLVRRFLRQCLVYCKRIEWDKLFLKSMIGVINDVIFHKESALGYLLHFMNIYPEELAKVSKGKLNSETVLLFIEPFIKLLAKTRDDRVQIAALEFFDYLMRQTDVGIEFEEKFHVWRQLGFPGSSLNSIKRESVRNGHEKGSDDDDDDDDDSLRGGSDDDNDEEDDDKPLDPRAGSVHVDLPQISFDVEELINLFKKYEHEKATTPKGRKKIRTLIQKFSVLKKGKFPARVKKDPIIDEKRKKPRLTMKTAKDLLKYTEEIDSGPIKSKDFAKIEKQLRKQRKKKGGNSNQGESDSEKEENEEENNDDDDNESDEIDEDENDELEESINGENGTESDDEEATLSDFDCENDEVEKTIKNKTKKKARKINNLRENFKITEKTENGKNVENGKAAKTINAKINTEEVTSQLKKKKKKRRRKKKRTEIENGTTEVGASGGDGPQTPSKNPKKLNRSNDAKGNENSQSNGSLMQNTKAEGPDNSTPVNKNGIKRKASSDWLVQELDENDPEYWKIKPQKVIILDGKKESPRESNGDTKKETGVDAKKEPETFTPVFWEKAKSKVSSSQKKPKRNSLFVNPMAIGNNESESPSLRRISFALEKNMAQENDEYLEEVRNSPNVPFDGSKKPVQSALKSGLSPSPINPFYRLKKIKF